MEYLDTLKGEGNRFDKGFALNSKDTTALRDALLDLLGRVEKLEARLTIEEPVEAQAEHEEVTDVDAYLKPKKRSRPSK